MKYKAEILIYQNVVSTYESDNVEDIAEWFKDGWDVLYDMGGCYLKVYRDGEVLDWDEKFELKIID
jgi:hypothetical protein